MRSRTAAFLCRAYPLSAMKLVRLIARYVDGEPWDDPELRNQLSQGLQAARTEAARLEPGGATPGPGRDAWTFYQTAAAILQDIQTEVGRAGSEPPSQPAAPAASENGDVRG